MNNQRSLLSTEFRWIRGTEPISHIICFICCVHHDKQQGLFANWGKLISVLTPTFHTCGKIPSVTHTGDITLRLINFSNPFDRSFHNTIKDCLLNWVVGNDPWKESAFAKSGRSGKVKLGGQW